MHEAILRNKTKFLTAAYTGGTHFFEDPLTSLVFGPMQYVPAHESFTFLSHLFEGKAPLFKAEAVKLHFWKKMRRTNAKWVAPKKWDALSKLGTIKDFVEPDLIIDFSGTRNEHRYYLIEVKWDSPEGENELFKQWKILENRIKRDAVHIFLIKHKPGSISNPEATVVLWDRLVAGLQHADTQQASLQFKVWREQTIGLLIKIASQFRPFSGFSNLGTPSPLWSFRSSNNSVISEHSDNCVKEPTMSSTNGSAIQNTIMGAIKIWDEIEALRREVTHSLAKNLCSYVGESGKEWCDSALDEETASVCTHYVWRYQFPRRRGNRFFCVTYLVTLLADPEAFPEMDEPTIHVALGEHDQFGLDEFNWQEDLEDDETYEVEIQCNGKLHLWGGQSGDAYYALPLTAIQDSGSIETKLVKPIEVQIRKRLGEATQADVDAVFAQEASILTFEKDEKGIRKKEG